MTYAGLRPATQLKDYQIEALPQRRWISAGGIRSTGLTGALDIAAPLWTKVPNLTVEPARP